MLQTPDVRFVLASGSAARRDLLRRTGIDFAVAVAAIDEAAVKHAARASGESAADAALILARMKACRIAHREPEALIIAADQILVCGDMWFDKPVDTAHAREQLRALRGRTHSLATAVVCQRGDRQVWQYVTQPQMTMRYFSDAFLEAYLEAEGEAVMSSVGGYRLEALGVQLFERIEGDHAAILGLPLLPLLSFLRQHGVLMV